MFPHTRFRMTLNKSSNLLIGEFSIEIEEHRRDVFPCSSGLRGHQTILDYWTRGKGPIPPSIAVAEDYRLNTSCYHSSKVGGLFFPISPDPIYPVGASPSVHGGTEGGSPMRCEIGLHLDTHGPGTSGCEGIQGKDNFQCVCEILASCKLAGHLSLPHYIKYLTDAPC